ncbi:MAG: HAD hydrolase-like protein [Candidatus Hodarchaeota archaeon]
MNDNAKRAPQWQKLVAEYFIPRFGGTPERWAEANFITLEREIKKAREALEGSYKGTYEEYHEEQQHAWIKNMFSLMNIEIPSKEECISLEQEAFAWITPRVRAAYPKVIETIKSLSNDYTLCTASGEHSTQLDGHLTGMGVRECFHRLYGPDLLGVFKTVKINNTFYPCIYDDLGIQPDQAIVIDDSPKVLKIAEASGAHVIQSCLPGNHEPQYENYFNDFADLIRLIKTI